MKNKNQIDHYLNLPWTYTIETESHKGQSYFIIRVNELPGICTDAIDLNQGLLDIKEAIACAVEIYLEKGKPVPVPVDREHYKGKILYRTDSDRHFLIAKFARSKHKSLSKTLDIIIDAGLEHLHFIHR